MVRPVSAAPFTSASVTVSCAVAPTATVESAGDTVTVFTGSAMTVIAEVPLLPSTVAVIVALPAPTPVTSPVALTDATAGAELFHVADLPATTPP